MASEFNANERRAPDDFLASALLDSRPGNGRRRLLSLSASLGFQALLGATLVTALATTPALVRASTYQQILYVPLFPRPVVKKISPPKPPPPPPVEVVEKRMAEPVPLPPPRPIPAVQKPLPAVKLPAPKFEAAAPTPAPDLMKAAVVAPPQLKTDNLQPSATPAAPAHTAHALEEGGFGDPEGPPAGHATRGNMAVMGSFDLPPGDGLGKGSSGGHGPAASGFGDVNGNGDGGQGSARHAQGPQVGGFGDATQPAAQVHAAAAPAAAALTPVEVLYKPDPQYSDEARALRLEGQVLLQVRFDASGELEILGVARGLGHGLDQQAIAAARQIRFKPAMRNGVATDTEAVLRITFQMTQ